MWIVPKEPHTNDFLDLNKQQSLYVYVIIYILKKFIRLAVTKL